MATNSVDLDNDSKKWVSPHKILDGVWLRRKLIVHKLWHVLMNFTQLMQQWMTNEMSCNRLLFLLALVEPEAEWRSQDKDGVCNQLWKGVLYPDDYDFFLTKVYDNSSLMFFSNYHYQETWHGVLLSG